MALITITSSDEDEMRDDVVTPGTGPGDNPVRDERGNVVAVTRLVRAR